MSIGQVIKRDGSVATFDRKRIENAIYAAARAVGNGEGRPWAETMSLAVVALLEERGNGVTPHVEEIQDVVEEVLVKSGNPRIAKAYILYRKQRADARATEKMLLDAEKLVEDYLHRADWRVNENSNMNYSLQGLNFYLASSIAARYWLERIYPQEVQHAHTDGDMHIHDLGMLSVYCCGWDLMDLLEQGFGGVSAKVESRPPKHLRTALGQLVNFFYTLQGESAGAVAVSNFDTLLAPFVRADHLDYAQTRQAVQEFVFNINVPTRVGFQCLSEDTEILTPEGWKGYEDVEVGDVIKTFNLATGTIEEQEVTRKFARPYTGPMYRLRNRIQDQLISPGHRVVRKKFNTDACFVLETIEQVKAYQSPVIVPLTGKNTNVARAITDDQIQLLAWIIAEGSKENYVSHRHSNRISIYQSQVASPENYAEIIAILERLGLDYRVQNSTPALGRVVQNIRLNAESSHRILDELFGTRERIKFIPPLLRNLDRRQARLFLDTYLKADGHEGCKITTTQVEILDGLQQIAVDAEYGFTVSCRKPTLGKNPLYILRLVDHQDTYIQKIETVDYSGVIWCPTTVNETVIARRNGKVFITGNTPFTNVTMDLVCPSTLAEEPVIVGGEMQSETYGEFQPEMDMLNRAFAEVMLAGDARGRVFTFPIPTYNIGRTFDWNNPNLAPAWAMTAKYGTPYFANFINSEMQPEDARSMCPLSGHTKVVVRSKQNGIRVEEIIHIVNNMNVKGTEYEVLTPNGSWAKARPVKVAATSVYRIWLSNGVYVDMGENHLQPVLGQGTLSARDLTVDMWLPFSKTTWEGALGSYDLGYAIGAYLGDGSRDDQSIVYSLCAFEPDDETVRQLKRIWNDLGFFVNVTFGERNVRFLRVSAGACDIVKRFVEGNDALDKRLTRLAFNGSGAFKLGILDGFKATDGSKEKKRLYTASEALRYDMAFLLASLGRKYNISTSDDRQDRLSEHTVYRIDYPERANYGNFYREDDTYHYYRITQIELLADFKGDNLYCFQVDHADHLFVLANGLVTHNCRLRLDNRELRRRAGGLFAAAPLTGSVGVVTLNMARQGYLARSEADFRERVMRMMEIARTSLEIKRKMLETFTERGLYPYSYHFLRNVKAGSDKFWSNHFSTIGLNGMHEACLNLLGVGIAHPDGRAFAIRTLEFMREVLLRFQEETGHLYNLEATPAEGAAYRLAKADRKHYPDIQTSGTAAAPYYTNSTHLPVNFSDDLFEVLDHQDDLQTLYTGGTVLHIFLGEQLSDWRQARRLVRTVAENYRLPYYTLTPTFSICPVHGYVSGNHAYCPHEHTPEQLAQFGRRAN